MKSLEKLLTLSAKDGQKENRAKWRNAHRAAFIKGKYAEGAMIDMGKTIQRSKETLYKWGDAARFYTLLIQIALQQSPSYKTLFFLLLRQASAKLSPWFFYSAARVWKYHENPLAVLMDFKVAIDEGWEIGKFNAELEKYYNPETPLPEDIAQAKTLDSLELLQTLEGDAYRVLEYKTKGVLMRQIWGLSPERLEQVGGLVKYLTNGARHVHCPACERDVELARFVESQPYEPF